MTKRKLIGKRSSGRTMSMLLDAIKWVANGGIAIMVAETGQSARSNARFVKEFVPEGYRHAVDSFGFADGRNLNKTVGWTGKLRVFVDHAVLDQQLRKLLGDLANNCTATDNPDQDVVLY